MVTHSHFSPHPTLPKCRHLPSSSYPGWNKLGPVCAHTLPGGMQRILEIWGSAEPGAVPELWRSRVHRHHHERQSLIARSKQEAGGRIAANVIPRWECFLTRSTCSHPAGKVWASSEGGQRENLISPCSAASANCRRGGRVEPVDGSERAWAAQPKASKGSCWPCPRSPGVPHMPGKIHLGTAVIVCSPGCLSLKTLAVLSGALPGMGMLQPRAFCVRMQRIPERAHPTESGACGHWIYHQKTFSEQCTSCLVITFSLLKRLFLFIIFVE